VRDLAEEPAADMAAAVAALAAAQGADPLDLLARWHGR
jgi:hypothetical protein